MPHSLYLLRLIYVSYTCRRQTWAHFLPPKKLLCVTCKGSLSCVLGCNACRIVMHWYFSLSPQSSLRCGAEIFSCPRIAAVHFPRCTAPVFCASLRSCLCYMFLVKVRGICHNICKIQFCTCYVTKARHECFFPHSVSCSRRNIVHYIGAP